jgi:hypothetical protein
MWFLVQTPTLSESAQPACSFLQLPPMQVRHRYVQGQNLKVALYLRAEKLSLAFPALLHCPGLKSILHYDELPSIVVSLCLCHSLCLTSMMRMDLMLLVCGGIKDNIVWSCGTIWARMLINNNVKPKPKKV